MYCNEDYFSKIDTKEKAYWLGFIFADGCVTKDMHCLIINLAPIDIRHLEKFNDCIESNYKIRWCDNNRYVSLRITNKYFVESLVRCGCVPAKSLILKYPKDDVLPKEFEKDFIRGYFDGDGCISILFVNKKNKPNPIFCGEINFLGTKDMLNHIAKIIPYDINKIRIFEFGKIFKFKISNKKGMKDVLSYLYDDSNMYLDRKYQKYKDNIDNFVDKRKIKTLSL